MAGRGLLDAALLDALGDAAAADHARRPVVGGTDQPAVMRQIAEGNVASARATDLPAEQVEAWGEAMAAALAARGAWLADRAAAGFVRRTHGDLHLGNLCLWQGRPVPFDALEFDETLATTDIAYDLAFLLMDLDVRAGRAEANRVLNRYVGRTGDAALVGGLAEFLSMRAMVRAHVAARSGGDGTAYLSLALAALHPPRGRVVAIGGLQGTGKTTLARALAPGLGAAPGALVLRSDEIRKRLHGVAPEQRLPASAYTAEANARTNAALLQAVQDAASGGRHAIIVDATFLDLAQRARIAEAARAAGLDFRGIWLQAPVAELERRIAARTGDASDATVEVLHRALAADPGPGDWMAVEAAGVKQALLF
jgi:predicted kinase